MKRYPFGKFILDVPDDHKIFEIHRNAVLYDRGFGSIIEAIGTASPKAAIIDIGGNVGDTAAYIASNVGNRIISVEGSPVYIPYFRSNLRHLGNQVTLVDKFIRPNSTASLRLDYQGGEGTGMLRPAGDSGIPDDRFITLEQLIALAKKTVGDICLVKSDTDGMDGFIVRDVIEKLNVPVFFECDTTVVMPGVANPWPGLFRTLSEKMYSTIVFDNFGLPVLIEEQNVEQVLRDLAGYAHLQRAIHPIRIHYYDVWAFPPKWKAVFEKVAEFLRSDLLKPFGF